MDCCEIAIGSPMEYGWLVYIVDGRNPWHLPCSTLLLAWPGQQLHIGDDSNQAPLGSHKHERVGVGSLRLGGIYREPYASKKNPC